MWDQLSREDSWPTISAEAHKRHSHTRLYTMPRYIRTMSARSFCIALATVLIWGSASAQFTVKDTAATALLPMTFAYSYQLPAADLSQRFGANHSLSFSAAYKFRSNYLLGVQGAFIFGNQVRQPGLLQNVINSQGQILSTDGTPAGVLIQQRGYSVLAYAGRIISVAGPTKNSGLMLRLGGGVLRHKIRIETQNDVVPQIEDENLEGYDRLSAGPAAYLFVGYQHFGKNRRVNFMVGYEIIQGFTEPLRAFNFDTEQADTDTRRDGLNGLRFGWTIPIYTQKSQRIFFN